MNWIELLGILASGVIAFSLIFKTSTLKGTLLMRGINAVGSSIFIVYAHLIHSAPVFILNAFTLMLNIFYFIKELMDYKRKNQNKQ